MYKIKSIAVTIIILMLIIASGTGTLSAQEPAEQAAPDIDTLVERGINYEQRNMFNEAIETYRQILSIDKNNSLAGIRLAKLLSWNSQLDEALEVIDTILDDSPDFSEALFRKAQILSWQKKYDESVEVYKKYLEIEKENADGFAGLARTYFWAGDFDNAVEYFNKAISAGYYNETELRLDLAKLYLNNNDPDSAKKEIDIVLEKDPANREAGELLATLPQFMKYEASLAVRGDFFQDSVTGFKLSPSFKYRYEKLWDFNLQYDMYALEGDVDNTISAGAVYKGINRLSAGAVLSYTPSPVFAEEFKLEGLASYSINRMLGAGFAAEALFYSDNANPEIADDTLYILKPSFSYYFTDISKATIQYINYIYSSGFTTSAVSLNVTVEYYNKNPVSLAITYGGDYGSKDSDRTLFEAGGSIFYSFTNNFEMGLIYNHAESEYSSSNQFTLIPVYRW